MGLDMYLRGKKFLPTNWDDRSKDRTEDGFRISEIQLELGYWRKEPNLHGFIVKEFAGGVDECQPIELNIDQMRQIISAVKARTLPHTTGFFFGRQYDPNSENAQERELALEFEKTTVEAFEKAIAWLEQWTDANGRWSKGCWPSVEYRASW